MEHVPYSVDFILRPLEHPMEISVGTAHHFVLKPYHIWRIDNLENYF